MQHTKNNTRYSHQRKCLYMVFIELHTCIVKKMIYSKRYMHLVAARAPVFIRYLRGVFKDVNTWSGAEPR